MSLSDEIVAGALGWVLEVHGDYIDWHKPDGTWESETPPFTTSLDAIVGEIEARGLWWGLGTSVYSPQRYSAHVKKVAVQDVETAPLALCHALLAYLKEHPDAC